MNSYIESILFVFMGAATTGIFFVLFFPVILILLGFLASIKVGYDAAQGIQKTNRMRILLVDDNPDSLLIMTSILKKHNCIFKIAASGAEAIMHLKTNAFDMIFLDYHMPEMNGPQMLDAAEQELADMPEVPVVYFSADNINIESAQEKKPWLHFKMVDSLTKQMSPLTLSLKVNKLLASDFV